MSESNYRDYKALNDQPFINRNIKWTATRCREIREAAEMSQAELADVMGIDKSRISKFESGRQKQQLATLCRWGRSCRVRSLEDLFVGAPRLSVTRTTDTPVVVVTEDRLLKVLKGKGMRIADARQVVAEIREGS